MSGSRSRSKGQRGERELVGLYRSHGFEAERNLGQEHEISEVFDVKTDVRGVDGIHIQAKRQEKIEMPKWIKQVLDEAPPDSIPTVHFRRNYPDQPHTWWVCLPLEDFLPLVRAWVDTLKRTGG